MLNYPRGALTISPQHASIDIDGFVHHLLNRKNLRSTRCGRRLPSGRATRCQRVASARRLPAHADRSGGTSNPVSPSSVTNSTPVPSRVAPPAYRNTSLQAALIRIARSVRPMACKNIASFVIGDSVTDQGIKPTNLTRSARPRSRASCINVFVNGPCPPIHRSASNPAWRESEHRNPCNKRDGPRENQWPAPRCGQQLISLAARLVGCRSTAGSKPYGMTSRIWPGLPAGICDERRKMLRCCANQSIGITHKRRKNGEYSDSAHFCLTMSLCHEMTRRTVRGNANAVKWPRGSGKCR